MRKIIMYILGGVLLVGAFFTMRYIAESNNKQKPKAEKIVKTVFVVTAKNETVPIVIPASGVLLAKNRLELYSEVQGIFQSSTNDFKPGQVYKQGQTLIRINAQEYYASVQSAKSEFYNLLTSIMPDLRLDYPEVFPQWQTYLENFSLDSSVRPLPNTTVEKANYFITGRGIYSAYYNIKNLEQRLSKYGIIAPFTGVLTEALVTKGTLIRQGQKLGEFIDTSVYEVELAIGKSFGDLLKIGEKVHLKSLDTEKTYTGNVSRINGRIDQATQTIKVFVEVMGDGLKEGMYLEAKLDARDETNAIKISRKLLVGEDQLFIVKDSILDILQVNPVYFSPREVVVKGVPDGTKLLAKPVPGAFAGMLVKIGDDSANQDNALKEPLD